MDHNIGIVGVGAIGSVIAKVLLSTGINQIKYYTRTAKSELKIEFNSNLEIIPIKCEVPPFKNEDLDWLIICLKAYHFQGAFPLLKSLITPNTKIAIIRNGINLSQDLEQFTIPENILPCIIDCPVQLQPNGSYWQIKEPEITTPKSELAAKFKQLFPQKDVTIHQVNDFKTASWKKLIESSALGSIKKYWTSAENSSLKELKWQKQMAPK